MFFLAFRGQIGKERALRKETAKGEVEVKEGKTEGRKGEGKGAGRRRGQGMPPERVSQDESEDTLSFR